ncbi:hypothetical protein ABZ805_20125 [Saccharopolyspora sp. NPDC047091]|uniref:hypothetical protein n=1 Tax=Saccharopolyspora sp. NPDC047091 TaxID=3155924 RepID=UPI0033E12619
MSATQVTGGALASVTAAFLGSYLGVAGTVFGAGLTSVVITVGGALYQRSLETTKEKLEVTKDKANVVVARAGIKKPTRVEQYVAATPVNGTAAPALRPQAPADEATRKIQLPGMHWPGGEQVDRDPDATRRLDPAEARTRMLSWGTTAGDATAAAERPTTEHSTAEDAAAEDAAGAGTEVVAPPRGRRLRWGVVAATSALIFGLGMLLITGFEGVVGKPLSGGDGGTTISKVFTPAAHRDTGDAVPQESETAEPSSSAEQETGSESQENTSGEPTSGASETTETGQSEATEPTGDTGASEAPEPTGARQPESGTTGERGSAGGESAQQEQPDAP